VSSSTANKVTIREAGPVSKDGYVVPVVVAAAASVRTCLADPQGRMRTAPGMEPPGLPEQLLRHVDAQAAVTLLQLTTPIRARCPQARTLLGELAATTDPNLSWTQRQPSAPEVSCPPASAS
jgi:hypothetical protein